MKISGDLIKSEIVKLLTDPDRKTGINLATDKNVRSSWKDFSDDKTDRNREIITLSFDEKFKMLDENNLPLKIFISIENTLIAALVLFLKNKSESFVETGENFNDTFEIMQYAVLKKESDPEYFNTEYFRSNTDTARFFSNNAEKNLSSLRFKMIGMNEIFSFFGDEIYNDGVLIGLRDGEDLLYVTDKYRKSHQFMFDPANLKTPTKIPKRDRASEIILTEEQRNFLKPQIDAMIGSIQCGVGVDIRDIRSISKSNYSYLSYGGIAKSLINAFYVEDAGENIKIHGITIFVKRKTGLEHDEILDFRVFKSFTGIIGKTIHLRCLYSGKPLKTRKYLMNAPIIFLSEPKNKNTIDFSFYEAYKIMKKDCDGDLQSILEIFYKMPGIEQFLKIGTSEIFKRMVCNTDSAIKKKNFGLSYKQLVLLNNFLSKDLVYKNYVSGQNVHSKMGWSFSYKNFKSLTDLISMKNIDNKKTFLQIIWFFCIKKNFILSFEDRRKKFLFDLISHYPEEKRLFIVKQISEMGLKIAVKISETSLSVADYAKKLDQFMENITEQDLNDRLSGSIGHGETKHLIGQLRSFVKNGGAEAYKEKIDQGLTNYFVKNEFDFSEIDEAATRLFYYASRVSDLFKTDFDFLLPEDETYQYDLYVDYLKNVEYLMRVNFDKSFSLNFSIDKLQRRHDETSDIATMVQAEKYKGDFAARYKKLNDRYAFSDDKFFIIAPLSPIDLIKEGRELGHCVGSYIESYGSGKTNILFVRKKEYPSKPFITMEILNDEIVQLYGRENKTNNESDFLSFIRNFSKIKNVSSGRFGY